MMRLSAWMLLAMAAWAWGEQTNSTNNIYNEHFPPIRADCTQSLTDLLLLRQEMQLQKVVSILTDMRGPAPNLPRVPENEWSCPSNFIKAGDLCLFFAKDKEETWDAARGFCQTIGADLAVFPDANNFAAALAVLRTLNVPKDTHIWVGGHDQVVEGSWKWITEDPMPRGSPFWELHDRIQEPHGGRAENCALLWEPSGFLLHDASCNWNCKPLCQIDPIGNAGGRR